MRPLDQPPPQPKARSKWPLAAGLVALGVALFALWPSRPGSPQRFTVPRGASVREIAASLKREGMIQNRWPFLLWARLTHGPIRPGVYILRAGASARSLLQSLRQGPPTIKLTFPEGWTAKQMAARLEAEGVAAAAPFLAQVAQGHYEGFLFPDTYLFDQGVSPRLVVDRMVRRFHEKEPKDMAERAKALHLTYAQIVTLASLVEKEARVPQERPIIAGVFLNRLKKHWRLESCASVEYALGAWKPQLTYKDLEVVSPYNTYRHAGLPPGPICNPGAAALEAAAHPAPTDMMFFVAEGGGTHRFSKYYKEHLAGKRMRKRR